MRKCHFPPQCVNTPGWLGLDRYRLSRLGLATVKAVARGTADLYRITNEILEIDGIERTSTAISILELMPPRYDGLISRLSEQESRPSE